jgi:hypothetical protein
MDPLTLEELKTLYRLLTRWCFQGNWNTASAAWAVIVESRRQVSIDIREVEPAWDPEE